MLKYTLLAFLAQRPRHGYDLKVEYDRALTVSKQSIAQPVNIGQIYSTLQRLEQVGWIAAQHGQGEGRERTVYTLTQAGQTALEAWLDAPIEPVGKLRDDFFAKLLVHQLAGVGDRVRMIANQRIVYMQWLGELAKAKARLTEDAPVMSRLLLGYAIRHARADLEWLDECEDTLSHL